MGILGIDNRTENWKTVQHFHGLSDAAKVALVRRLGEPKDTAAEEIGIELFWRGMRDFDFCKEVKPDDLVKTYRRIFGNLRKEICEFDGLSLPEGRSYAVSDVEALVSNIKNTEVDIVLETPDRIFIGEAKYESDLGTGSSVLVHQLIRQYVTARILVHLSDRKKRVVPFVVARKSDLPTIMKKKQIQFMMAERQNKEVWLCKKNILSWGEVNDMRFGFSVTSTTPCPCQGTDAEVE